MPSHKTKSNNVAIEGWNHYRKVHRADGNYRPLNMKDVELVFQETMRSNEKYIQQIHDAFMEIAVRYDVMVAYGSTERVIDKPEYRKIAYEEIIKCIVFWDGERVIWRDPVKGGEYEKISDAFVKSGQYIYETFLEETFYQYAVTKAIRAGQSLKDKERILKRQVDHNQRVGKKPPLTKYNTVKQIRKIATKQGRYVTKFLEYYNKSFIALPLAAWTNVFDLNASTLPEETDFRNSIKALISQYINGTLLELKSYPWWYEYYQKSKKQPKS